MDDDFIRRQIEGNAARASHEHPTAIGRILTACWPGGPADRCQPAALRWLRHWRPATANLVLPVCSCHAGRCALCN